MQGDDAMNYIARNKYTFTRYLVRRHQLPNDKMAEYFFLLWQKMAVKKFAYIKKKQYLCSVIQKGT